MWQQCIAYALISIRNPRMHCDRNVKSKFSEY